VSGENTENPQDSGEDATAGAPVPEGEASAALPTAPGVEPFAVPAPETVAIPDAEAAIEDFTVPPPPKFGVAPPPPSVEPVIPPASSSEIAGDAPALRKRGAWAPNDTWTSASAHKQEPVPPTAAQKAESRAAASRAATARDEATRNYVSPAAGGTEGTSYRGWSILIFAVLALLFVGAIVLIAFLVGNAPMSFDSAAFDAFVGASAPGGMLN